MIGIIDGDILIYRACHKSLKENLDVTATFDQLLEDLYDQMACSSYSLHISGGGNFRKKLKQNFTVYKGKRKEKPANYLFLRNYILKNHDVISVPFYEADDTAAIEATIYQNEGKLYTLATIDKDWIQIGGIIYNMQYKSLKAYSTAEAISFFHHQLVMGDAVDNIPGIYGMGKKKAEKLLKGKSLIRQFAAIRRLYKEVHGNDSDGILNSMGRLLYLVREYDAKLWCVEDWLEYLNETV